MGNDAWDIAFNLVIFLFGSVVSLLIYIWNENRKSSKEDMDESKKKADSMERSLDKKIEQVERKLEEVEKLVITIRLEHQSLDSTIKVLNKTIENLSDWLRSVSQGQQKLAETIHNHGTDIAVLKTKD